MELEVPEIHDGTVEIKSVSREPGARSKIAVFSENENIDPVGSCVGPKGSRVQRVVDELSGEKIDIVNWNEDPRIFVANALSPSKVVEIFLEEEQKAARVVVPDNQLSLAIGKEGQNVRLAANLTGWKIDIKSETQMEQYIEEHGGEEAFQVEDSDFTMRLAALMEEDEEYMAEKKKKEEEEGETSCSLSDLMEEDMNEDLDDAMNHKEEVSNIEEVNQEDEE